MEIKEVELFIDQTIYDFQTIEYLLEFGRIKETVPVMQHILARIESFHLQANSKQGEIKRIFHDSFWDKVFIDDLTLGDLRVKIMGFSRQPNAVLEKDLEAIGYQPFIRLTRQWAFDNIFQLRQFIKNPRLKKIEIFLIVLSACALGLCLGVILFLKFFTQDWGLRGDFYQGQNFEKHVATGDNKTINFGYYLEMNPLIPYEHSSARWHGILKIPQNGAYTFYLLMDDGARLFIDNNLLIDEWHNNNSVEYKKKIYLSKGKHDIRLDYFNNFENSVLKLYWAFEGTKKEIIPAWYLRHKV